MMKKYILFILLLLSATNLFAKRDNWPYGRMWTLYTEVGISQRIYHGENNINFVLPYNLGFKLHNYGQRRLKYEFQFNVKCIDVRELNFSRTYVWNFEYFSGLRFWPYNASFRLGKSLFFKPTASASVGCALYNFRSFDVITQVSLGFSMTFKNNQRGFLFEFVYRPFSFPYTHVSRDGLYYKSSWAFRFGVNLSKY